jgi:membrane-associated protease RseP (regulator of RpoE activity)
VLGWEAITGKEVDVRKLIPIAAAVISFFVLLFIAVLYLDLARPIKAPF